MLFSRKMLIVALETALFALMAFPTAFAAPSPDDLFTSQNGSAIKKEFRRDLVPVLNVEWYGAVPNDGSDDTLAIQAALDDAATRPTGAEVYIPPGVYLISDTMLVGSNTRIKGAGRGSTILRGMGSSFPGKVVNGSSSNHAVFAMVGVNHSSVESLTIDQFMNHTQANGVIMVPDGANSSGNPCAYCMVRDVEVLGFDAHQYLIWSQRSRHVKILNNFVNGNYTQVDLTTDSNGISIYGGRDIIIDGNTVENFGCGGINAGSSASGITDTQTEDLIISNNYIINCAWGISLGPYYDSSVGNAYVARVSISNNKVVNSGDAGILLYLMADNCTIKDVVIMGNSITNSLRGIYMEGQSATLTRNHSGIVISANTIDNTTTTTGGGVHAQFVDNISITDNNIHDSAGQAAFFYGCNNVLLSNNILSTSQFDAMQIFGDSGHKGSSFKISGNTFREFNASNSYGIGIRLINAVNVVIDNNFFDTSHPRNAIYADTTNDRIRIGRNNTLYAFPPNPLFYNGGTNPNKGTVSMAVGQNSIHLDNTLVIDGSRIVVTQIAPSSGTGQQGFAATPDVNGGGFTITMSQVSSDGSEVFSWDIEQ